VKKRKKARSEKKSGVVGREPDSLSVGVIGQAWGKPKVGVTSIVTIGSVTEPPPVQKGGTLPGGNKLNEERVGRIMHGMKATQRLRRASKKKKNKEEKDYVTLLH